MKAFAIIRLFSSVLLVVMALPTVSHGLVITAGELVVDLRALDLTAGATTWTNKDTTGASVGHFVTKGGGSLGIAGIGGINRSLFVNTDINKAVVSALNAPAELLGNNTRSVEIWVYALTVSPTAASVAWGTSGTAFQSSFNYSTGGNGMFSGWSLDTGWNGSLLTGRWVYLAYTYDGTTLKSFTNGVLNKSVAFGPMSTASAKISVGAARAATADAFQGYIADVRVHTGVLSASDVANNYGQGIYSTLPTITSLTNQTVQVGGTLVLSPTVAGFPDPTCQWQTNGIAILNQTNVALTVPNIQPGQNGYVYSLVASNSAGKVTNSMTLTVVALPIITGLNNQAVTPGATVTMAATVSGLPAPTLQWRFNGVNLANGATGNGSTIGGSTSSTLIVTNAQVADTGTYSLMASNNAGMVTNSVTLTVSSGNVAPSITGPTDQTVVQTSNATFNASVSGLPVPTLQWRVNGTNISGATSSSLTVSNVQYAQNSHEYSLVASNDAGMATNSATLYVLVPTTISQQPTNLSVIVGTPATFNVGAGGVPAVKYQWSRNGSPIANATNTAYTLSNPQGADNGAVFSVTVSNSVAMVTSSNAVLTVLSTMTGTLLPTNGAVNIAPDQQLRIVFSSTPTIGTGKLFVRDAATHAVHATIDTSLFQTISLFSATITNAYVRTVQGASYFYMPIAIYGNQAWITLNSSNRLAYNKTYYVNAEAGLFRDSSSASFPAITGTNAWRISTKPSGPATPTASTGLTNLTVAHDGAGDFATLQGASDWVPQNNTLQRSITIQPGTYRDNATFAQNRHKVRILGGGANRQDVQLFYPYPSFSTANGAGTLRIESSDVYVRNLTIDNAVYLTNNGVVFAGPIQTVQTTGDRLIFDNVLIKGGQDTLYTIDGIAYFFNCEIWGSVDFIYGRALGVFDRCDIVQIRTTGGPVNAPNTLLAQPYGEVFLNCRFPRALVANGYPYDVNIGTTTFMRPWRQDGATAIINCQLDTHISTKGWSEWVGSEGAKEVTCRAREYGSTMIGGGAAPTPAERRSAGAYWLNTIDPDYTGLPMEPSNPLVAPGTGTGNRVPVTVNPADYTLAAIFGHAYFNLGGWLPTTIPTITLQPTNKTVSAGAPASFTIAAMAQPAPLYQWRKNGTNISGATNATLAMVSVVLADTGTYSVLVSNSAGFVTSSNAVLTVPAQPVSITPGIANGLLTLSWPANQTGFRLLTQTNPPGVGMTTNWYPIAGSSATNQIVLPIAPEKGSVFFQLSYP
jgi:pectin methylesterase-like acyl-CoA thioesterase